MVKGSCSLPFRFSLPLFHARPFLFRKCEAHMSKKERCLPLPFRNLACHAFVPRCAAAEGSKPDNNLYQHTHSQQLLAALPWAFSWSFWSVYFSTSWPPNLAQAWPASLHVCSAIKLALVPFSTWSWRHTPGLQASSRGRLFVLSRSYPCCSGKAMPS
jgi:hypothetical protein